MQLESKNKQIYWITTIPFLLWMIASAFGFLLHLQEIVDSITGLGYPPYILKILGVAKILGVIAILQTRYITLKEWAYAGFTIDLLGASGSLIFSGDTLLNVIIPLIVLALVLTSYRFWKLTKI